MNKFKARKIHATQYENKNRGTKISENVAISVSRRKSARVVLYKQSRYQGVVYSTDSFAKVIIPIYCSEVRIPPGLSAPNSRKTKDIVAYRTRMLLKFINQGGGCRLLPLGQVVSPNSSAQEILASYALS
jgi:hypothetical protein